MVSNVIVKLRIDECRGKLSTKKKVQTIVEVSSVEALTENYTNAKTANTIIYNGDIDSFVEAFTPDTASNINVLYEVNPDIINLQVLDKLKDYNVLCRVPKEYNNMEQLFKLNSMYPNVRFCGGHLLLINGVNIGAILFEKPKRYIFKDEYSCQEDVVDLSYLDENGIIYEFVAPKENGVKSIRPKRPSKPKSDKPKVSKAKTKAKEPKPKKQSKYISGGMDAF